MNMKWINNNLGRAKANTSFWTVSSNHSPGPTSGLDLLSPEKTMGHTIKGEKHVMWVYQTMYKTSHKLPKRDFSFPKKNIVQ